MISSAISRSNIVLLDTYSHIDYFSDTFSIGKDKFRRILVGADDTIFYPRRPASNDDFFHVLYYGEFNPLHGIEYIVKAAAILGKKNEIKFTIIGKGREHARIIHMVKSLGISNIHFIDWVPYKSLPDIIAQSDLCLGGHFGDSLKSKRVIAGKTYQMMAMQKPLILGKNDDNLRNKIASNAYNIFKNKCSINEIGRQIRSVLNEFV